MLERFSNINWQGVIICLLLGIIVVPPLAINMVYRMEARKARRKTEKSTASEDEPTPSE